MNTSLHQGKYIDLHTHSIYSDGSLTPRRLVDAAADAGLTAIALTDHDTVDGVLEAVDAGWRYNVEVIPGIELSTSLAGYPSIHILGYYIDINNRALEHALRIQSQGRKAVHESYLKRLGEFGFHMTHEEVVKHCPNGQIGRVHYARVMQEKGYADSFQQAFEDYFSTGMPIYLERETMTPEKAIEIIHGAGGVAFLAHPYQLKLEFSELESLTIHLKSIGLNGIEAYYSEHSTIDQERILMLAEKLGLLVCGGSDYHADMKPHIQIGSGISDKLRVPYHLIDDIKKARPKVKGMYQKKI